MGKSCEMFYLFFGFFLDTKIMECLFLLLLLLSPIPRTDFRAWTVRLRFAVLPAAIDVDVDVDVAVCLLVVVWLPRLGFLVPEDESGRSNFSQDMRL